MAMPISQENLQEAIRDAYAIANIYKLTVTRESYLRREVAVWNESALKTWVNRDPRFSEAKRVELLERISRGTEAALGGAVGGGVVLGVLGGVGAKALMVKGIIVAPLNPVAGAAIIGAGAVVGVAGGILGGGYLGAKIAGLPSSDRELDALYNSYNDFLCFQIFRSLLAPGQVRALRVNISPEFFCTLSGDKFPEFAVRDTWKIRRQEANQYYDYEQLATWMNAHPGKLNSPRPLRHHALSLNHATDYWPRLSAELQLNFGGARAFNERMFESKEQNRAFMQKCLLQLHFSEGEHVSNEEEYPAGLYGMCKQFLQDQKKKIPAEDR